MNTMLISCQEKKSPPWKKVCSSVSAQRSLTLYYLFKKHHLLGDFLVFQKPKWNNTVRSDCNSMSPR